MTWYWWMLLGAAVALIGRWAYNDYRDMADYLRGRGR